MERHRFHKKSSRVLVVVGSLGLASMVFLGRSPSTIQAGSDATRQGAELFATSGCTHCHGAEGMGTERGPSLRELRKHLSAAEIEHQIVIGGKAMPAFGDSLDHAQVADLVAFLRAKKWVPAPQPPPAAPAPSPAP